ncbi:integrase catalytic domain-containing protein [Trichonephila clavipes]|nr:integrase catalytic domain-containing protein [Trichonephila clavipes]
MLGRRIAARQPPSSCLPELRRALLDEWCNILQDQIDNLILSMPRRWLSPPGRRAPQFEKHWIKGSASKFKPFASNRISEIQENTAPVSWRHCSGKQNPADLLIRGLTSKELINSEKWWHGPEWLKDSENLLPKLEVFESMDSETVERKDIVNGPLAAEELSNAEIFWVKVTQNDFYTSEITCLKSNKTLQKDSKLYLKPFLDGNGVLRVTGRLGKTTHLSANEKHLIILPSKSRLTELLIWESHKRVFHSGVSHTLVQVREILDFESSSDYKVSLEKVHYV